MAARTAAVLAPARGEGRVLGLLPSARNGRGGAGGRQAGTRTARGDRADRRALEAIGQGEVRAPDVAISLRAPGLRHRLRPVRPGALPAAARREVERVEG